MSDATDTVREQANRAAAADQDTMVLDLDGVSYETFTTEVLPYAIGYVSGKGYGLTDVEYEYKTLTFARLADETATP